MIILCNQKLELVILKIRGSDKLIQITKSIEVI